MPLMEGSCCYCQAGLRPQRAEGYFRWDAIEAARLTLSPITTNTGRAAACSRRDGYVTFISPTADKVNNTRHF